MSQIEMSSKMCTFDSYAGRLFFKELTVIRLDFYKSVLVPIIQIMLWFHSASLDPHLPHLHGFYIGSRQVTELSAAIASLSVGRDS